MVVVALAGNSGTSLWSKAPDLGITSGISDLYNTVVNTNLSGLTSLSASGAAGAFGFVALSKYLAKANPRQFLAYTAATVAVALASSQYEGHVGATVSQKVAMGITGFALSALPTAIHHGREWNKKRVETLAAAAAAAVASKTAAAAGAGAAAAAAAGGSGDGASSHPHDQ